MWQHPFPESVDSSSESAGATGYAYGAKENFPWRKPQKSLLHESAAYTPANGISTKMRAGPDAVLFSPQNTPKEERHADWCVAIS
jgi:hypothetical protein